MRIEFVNHSSAVIESGSTRLLMDPWLEGRAFDDGWALLAPSRFRYEDFASITHLWFSHEHPDHFSPPVLRKIPAEIRKRIVVLYQRTADRKVVEFCRKLGFGEVRELELGRWTSIAEGFDLYCDAWGKGDSFLCVRTPEARLLNLNDCMVNSEASCRAVSAAVGPVDVLMTQFSISSWDGNAEDVERRRGGARTMLERTVRQGRIFQPRHLIPFASFIWFCHAENHYMNDAFIGIEAVYDKLRHELPQPPVVLYPGDAWEVGAPWSSAAAVASYARDQATVPTRERVAPAVVSEADLRAAAEEFRKKLLASTAPLKMRAGLARRSFRHRRRTGHGNVLARLADLARLRPEPCWIHVCDHARSYSFDLAHGLRPSARARAACDLELGAEGLAYAFRFLWGGLTLQINGRFHELRPDGRDPLYEYFYAADHLNSGGEVRWGTLLKRFGIRAKGGIDRHAVREQTRGE